MSASAMSSSTLTVRTPRLANCRAPAAISDARMRSRRRAMRGLAAAGPFFSGGLVLTRVSIH
jgi:hypothetical protein